jgi:membrane-associated phospholipid phosphatase
MREMDDIPKDNTKKSNILVDDDEDEIANNNNQKNKSNNNNNIMVNPQDINLNIREIEKENENHSDENNYLSQMFYKNLTLNIIIILSFFVLIMLEFIYRRDLFTYSLTYEQNLQNSLSKNAIQFFKIVSLLGGYVFIGLGLCFVFCYYPLNKSIILSVCLIFVVYLHDMMKLLYGDPRPFWVNTILFTDNCEISYGNPSGHSLVGFFFYTSLSYYICMLDNIKYNSTYKTGVYFTGIIISSLTAFSRLVLGVHSIDQVVYGSALGIWLFFIFMYVFKIYDMPLSYYLKFYKDKKYSNVFMIILTLLLIISVILYNLIDIESDFKKYNLVMEKRCPNAPKHKFYSNSCLAGTLIILLVFGIYLGQYLFWYLVNRNNSLNNDINYLMSLEDSINHWNNNYKEIFSSIGNIAKVILLIIICLLPGLFYVFVSGEDNSLRTIFVFKIGLPLFLIGFLTFGPCFYALIYILKEKREAL